MASKPTSATVRTWLKLNGLQLGALTGTDNFALLASVQIAELYGYDPSLAVIQAWEKVVGRMQPGNHHLAYHAIAHALDWSYRQQIWGQCALGQYPMTRCSGEPRL